MTNTNMAANQRITIAWGGDVNLGRRFHYRWREAPNECSLANLAPLREADLCIVNLECAVAYGGKLGVDKNERASYYFRARPETLQELIRGGIDVVATANNHSGDYGPAAVLEQASWMNKSGLLHAGSGENTTAAWCPATCNVGGISVAIFSIDCTQRSFAATENSAGNAYLDPTTHADWPRQLAPRFQEARKQADLILVAVHWGANGRASPSPNKIAAGHALIDAGADAVLGSSAHVLQGIEVYQGRPIIHDAGDLFFDAVQRANKDSGIFLLQASHAGIHQVQFIPAEVGFCRTTLRTSDAAKAATQRFSTLCSALGTSLNPDPSGTGTVRCTPPPRPKANATLVPALPLVNVQALLTLPSPLPDWVASEVPMEAQLPRPVRIGALELLGVKASPSVLRRRGLVFVESYWRLYGSTQQDWRIEFQAVPQAGTKLKVWGASSDHDPCDWMWPTSRWQPGTIYRDTYSLRPDTIRYWQDSILKLRVRLKTGKEQTPWFELPVEIKFALEHEEAFSVLRHHPPQYLSSFQGSLSAPSGVLWTAAQLQRITGGTWLQEPPAGWCLGSISHKRNFLKSDAYPRPRFFVATDNRVVAHHELYSDLSGAPWDSHRRLPAFPAEMEGALVAKSVANPDPKMPLLQVGDPLHALMELGVAGRQRLRGHVVAVTGSAGKSSLCCMLAQAMAVDQRVRTNAVENYNSRCGLLHHLANTPEHTDLVVLEAAVSAINSPGLQHIKLVKPDIAVITNIAPSHLPPGKTLAYVAQRKGNIVEGLPRGGKLVLYRETPHFEYLYQRARARDIDVITYGANKDCSIRLEYYDAGTGVVKARLSTRETATYRLEANGMHMALNSLACLAVRRILGGSIPIFLPALEGFLPEAGRGRIHQVRYKGLELTLVDESYNANPLSMRMALQAMEKNSSKHKCVLILGDMRELGDEEIRHHEALAPLITALGPDRVLLCGKRMRHLWEKLRQDTTFNAKGDWFADVSALESAVDRWLLPGDRVLIKSSNSTGLHALAERLTRGQPCP